ncbi:hypothetical protein OH76DRAFT_84337 [Lentinus brumalis]|uniref:Uncharacterized protein n=1 Tax=Lentinus brumalis TaxID=2498619 RepID=A0A371CQZ1_9APHY|nr:hypothetical protein OH76DRAFT_84337 [Polyporus brumalis]
MHDDRHPRPIMPPSSPRTVVPLSSDDDKAMNTRLFALGECAIEDVAPAVYLSGSEGRTSKEPFRRSVLHPPPVSIPRVGVLPRSIAQVSVGPAVTVGSTCGCHTTSGCRTNRWEFSQRCPSVQRVPSLSDGPCATAHTAVLVKGPAVLENDMCGTKRS